MKRLLLLAILLMSAIWSSNAYADGYGGFWEIDDPATFRVVVSDASGISQAADTNVYWRVYEDETGTSLLNGTMTRIDSSNFAGLYTEQMTLSAANGFEVGKSYSFAAKAGVDGATGNYVQGFQVIDPDNFKAVITSLATAANLQTVDDNVDGVKAKTDNLTFTTANKVDARVDYVGTNAVITPDDFKADVSSVSTFDPASDEVDIGEVKGVAVTGVADFKATGFSTHNAGDVWTNGTRTLTDPNSYKADVSSLLTESVFLARLLDATTEITSDIAGLSIPTVNQIVAGIWAESLPGSFNSGEAGYILGTNLDATVSSRSSHAAPSGWATPANINSATAYLAGQIAAGTADILAVSDEFGSGGGGGDATAANQLILSASLNILEASALWMQQVMESDEIIGSATPYIVTNYVKGGTSTVLIQKALQDINGNAVTDLTTTPVARKVENE